MGPGRCSSERGVPMTLSERERRLLQEMETHLLAEDPSLASSLGAGRLRAGTRILLAASGLVIGVLVMGAGVLQGDLLGVGVALIGYLVLLAATVVGVETLRQRVERNAPRPTRPPGTAGPSST